MSSALLALGLGLALPAAARAATVEGQLFDRSGAPLAGVSVAVLERTGGNPLGLGGPAVDETLGSVSTDRQGFFAFDTGPRSVRGRVIVRVAGGAGWDARRFVAPVDRDVTAPLRDRGRAVVAIPVDDAPGWTELQREIVRVGGPESDRGRILRSQGMPPETVAQNDGVVEWRYPGVSYLFKDGALVDTRRAAPAPAGAQETSR